MKLKHDFITNSSTTAYMIVIPEMFSFQKYLTIREQAGHGELNESLIKRVTQTINVCERDGSTSLFYDNYEQSTPILDFFTELGLVAGTIDFDGSEGYYFLFTSASKVKEVENRFLEKTSENKK